MRDFPALLITSTNPYPLGYPFRAEPLRLCHYREYPEYPSPGPNVTVSQAPLTPQKRLTSLFKYMFLKGAFQVRPDRLTVDMF